MKKNTTTRLLQTFVSVVIFGLGVLAGPILETRVSPLLSGENMPITIFILMITVLGVALALWGYSQKSVSSIEKNVDNLAKALGSQVRILPYTLAYEELIKQVGTAQTEIRILSKYIFDWKNGKSIYDLERFHSTDRSKVYDALNAKVLKENDNSGFNFIRIVEIPRGNSLNEVFPFDEIYKEHCSLIAKISKNRPEFARVKVSDIIFDRSFAIIDRSFLYMEFEVYDPDTNQYKAPFTLVIEDQDSGVINELVQLHQRIDAKATLYTG